MEPNQTPRVLRFGAFDVDLRACQLRKHGLKIKLQGQTFDILNVFLENPGQLVTRDDLRRRMWPDGTFVDFGNSLNTAVNKLREALGDSASNPRYVETLPRRDYRFIASVEAVEQAAGLPRNAVEVAETPGPSLQGQAASTAPRPAARNAKMASRILRVVVAALVFTVLITAGHFALKRSDSSAATAKGKIMLAILPFQNIRGDPGQDYISDGLTEELITQLGRLQPDRLGVIARSSVAHYKHSDKSIDQIGRELGVHFALEGSVRRSGDRIRITAQLVQVRDQTHLWAETFERDVKDILNIQQEVAAHIAQALATELLPIRSSFHSGVIN